MVNSMSPSDAPADANTLFLSTELDDVTGACLDHLPAGTLDGANLTFVAYSLTADGVVDRLRRRAGSQPARLDVVDVGGVLRSATSASTSTTLQPGLTVHTAAPADLTGLGITLTELLTAEDGPRTVLCFDSLTMLLQYVDVETAYRFLHVLTGRISAVGATGAFHMDPSAHDEQTVGAMKSLFDGVVDLD